MTTDTRRMRDASYWTAAREFPSHGALQGEIEAEVAIVGGGMVGVVAARLLADAGRDVAVIDAGRVGHGVTGRSTAKVTAQHALKLHSIEDRHGAEAARAYAAANRLGVELIAELVARHALACDFEAADSFVYATTETGAEELEAEHAAAGRAGLAMELVTGTELPYPTKGALRLAGQAQFQPAAFVSGLAATLRDSGVQVCENSAVTDWDEHGVRTRTGAVRAPTVVMATHLPLGQVGQFHAHTSPHMHAVMAVPVPAGRAPHGMYISADEPKRSLRRHRAADGSTVLILAGPTFKHGDPSGERAAFEQLEEFAREHFGWRGGGWRWTNEDYTPRDGLPYVGWAGAQGESPLVATGFDAWGLSNGAAAARIIADLIVGRDNPWHEHFDASRHSATGLGKLAASAGKFAADVIKGHVAPKTESALPARPGEAALVEIDGKVSGVFRDDGGALHAVSAVCTHMGCTLGWNPVDRTWDCPCHGSRFAVDGAVRHGPAVEPLSRIALENDR